MQPLHSGSPKNGKSSMLKRMSRVRSDEKEDSLEQDELHDKTPSPIGAGLPLLQRLRLLKEKQVRSLSLSELNFIQYFSKINPYTKDKFYHY